MELQNETRPAPAYYDYAPFRLRAAARIMDGLLLTLALGLVFLVDKLTNVVVVRD